MNCLLDKNEVAIKSIIKLAIYHTISLASSLSLLHGWGPALVASIVLVCLSLLHEIGDRLLEFVDTRAHLVDAADDAVAHGLEAALHLCKHLLHQLSELVGTVTALPWLLLLLVLVHLARRNFIFKLYNLKSIL